MSDGDEGATARPRPMRTGRMEAFSDGVFAIAITLLVLEIAVNPQAGEQDLLRAVLDQWPSYLAYLVSFSTVGALWLAHNAITEYLERADATLLRLNLLLLMVVSFLPFPTKLLGEFIQKNQAERVAATIYGLNLFLASGLVAVLWRYAVRERLVRPDADDTEVQLLTRRLTPGLGGYVVLIVLGLFRPVAAVVGYLVIAVFFILPIHEVGRSRRRASRG
jgi:uncharacterized membrane protein